MFLDRYLTEYDDSLSGESYIDPMGELVIWSSYGEQIFQKRVNSISNDVRNYTLNLFNHYVIRSVEEAIKDQQIHLSSQLQKKCSNIRQFYFKHACILYLENLFVYSMLHNEKKGADMTGVLGSLRGRKNWTESDGNPELLFVDNSNPKAELLKRQVSLGVNGRYRTPMLEMGYFDVNYDYHHRVAGENDRWPEVKNFIESNTPLKKLHSLLLEHFSELLQQKKAEPVFLFQELPEGIAKAYFNAFTSSARVGGYARDYWLGVTGLDSGASGALLTVLNEAMQNNNGNELEAEDVVYRALKLPLHDEEKEKLDHLIQLEPFLSDAMLLFSLMTAKKAQHKDEVIKQWQDDFKRTESTLPRHAGTLLNNSKLIAVVQGTAKLRLNKLLQLSGAKTMDEQIQSIYEYHSSVMSGRDQLPWFDIDHSGLIKVNVRPSYLPDAKGWPPGSWYNSYYMPQFKSLVRGLQGETE